MSGGAIPRWICALTVVGSLAGCGQTVDRSDPQDSAVAAAREVTFQASDQVGLAGRLFGSGDAGVILAHSSAFDQAFWYPLAARLAENGYRVLTFNFRGFCPGGDAGCSSGDRIYSETWKDVIGAITFMRSLEMRTLQLVGEGDGGTACLVAAAQPDVDVDSVVTMSAPDYSPGYNLIRDQALLARIGAPKMFVAAKLDPGQANSAINLYSWSSPPKQINLLPTKGPILLESDQAEAATELIAGFLRRYA